jgi:hypothetical protein
MPKSLSVVIASALAILAFDVSAQDAKPKNGHGHRGQAVTNFFNVAVPAHAYDLILARPENNFVTLSALAYQSMDGFVAYGIQSGACTNQTPICHFKSGVPVEFAINPLQANTKYFYQFHSRLAGASQFTVSPEYSFQTARPPGSTFTFTMTADVHLDEHTSAEVYEQSLANIRAEQPDFHIDLGNLFMTDKHATRDEAARQYLAQRFYLGQLGSPLFLALGVHDGESSRYDDGSPGNLADWSNALRIKYFPNPLPDSFYSGDAIPKAPSGLLENYYAWTWGDALFVVLDPYRYSLRQRGGGGDGWAPKEIQIHFHPQHACRRSGFARRRGNRRFQRMGRKKLGWHRRLRAASSKLAHAGSQTPFAKSRHRRIPGARQLLRAAGTRQHFVSDGSSTQLCWQ